jgi:hypothetical protein
MACARTGAMAAMLMVAAAAPACELPAGERLSSQRFELSYRTVPERIGIGRHFVLEVAACPRAGMAAPEALRVDASMPEHRHGMNYKASVANLPGGRFRADGLMFHMAGRWELVFELRGAGRTDRLSRSVVVE